MKKSPNKGTAITQYIIILLLVCLVCIPAFFILGKSIFDYFNSFKSGMSNGDTVSLISTQEGNNSSGVNTETNSSQDNNSEENASGTGTPYKPQKNCENDTCSIDYGEFMLNGVPSNLSEHLKVSGSSGATNYMAQLLDQILGQTENTDLTEDDINLIKNLSNICHQIAILQFELENNAQSLVDKYNQNGFFLGESNSDTYYQDKMTQLEDLKIQMNDIISQMNTEEILNKISASNFAQEYQVVLQLGDIVSDRVNTFGSLASQINGSINDQNQLLTLNEFLELNASFKTKEDSKVICSYAAGTDTGIKCK